MKKILLSKYNKAIAFFLAILGFATACDEIVGADEYGSPHADFIVNGSIKSELSSSVIKNIRVIMRDTSSHYVYSDTCFTDANGSYNVKLIEFPNNQVFKINLQDIDGSANGEFQTLDTIVEFKNPVFTGGDGHWNDGHTDKEMNLKMKPKVQ